MSELQAAALLAAVAFCLAFPAFMAVLVLMGRIDELEEQLRREGVPVGTKRHRADKDEVTGY